MAVQQQVGVEVVGKKPSFLRVKVTDTAKEGRPTVNVKVPISVVKFGMKMAQSFSPEMKDAKVDWDAVVAMIDAGEVGKLVEVEDQAKNQTVEVWVE